MNITVHQRNEPLRCFALGVGDLRALLVKLGGFVEEAHARELEKLRDNPNFDDEQKANFRAPIRNANVLWTTIFGSRGEQYFFHGTQFDEDQLPRVVTRVLTGNINPYRNALKIEPDRGFEVTLDFSVPPILDWTTPLSAPTSNESYVLARGDEVWTAAVIKSVEDTLHHSRTARSFLHRSFLYDLLLFVVALPIAFLAAKRLSGIIDSISGPGLTTLSVMLNVYVFLTSVWVFRLLFSYVRWVFPPMEFTSAKRSLAPHRWLLGVIVAAVIAEVVHSIFVLSAAAP